MVRLTRSMGKTQPNLQEALCSGLVSIGFLVSTGSEKLLPPAPCTSAENGSGGRERWSWRGVGMKLNLELIWSIGVPGRLLDINGGSMQRPARLPRTQHGLRWWRGWADGLRGLEPDESNPGPTCHAAWDGLVYGLDWVPTAPRTGWFLSVTRQDV